MKKSLRIYSVAFSLLFVLSASAQSDSSENNRHRINPKKATLLSVALPGAGQFYNRSYWKIPVIYAGFTGLAYGISFNHGEYKRFGDYYRLATDDDPATNPDFPGTPEQLRQKRDYYKKYRDLSIIGACALYALQILDANVDAHLSYFDISDDLSLGWTPRVMPTDYFSRRPAGGLQLVLRF